MRTGPWSRGLDDGKSSVLPIWKIRKKADRIITSTIRHHHCHLLPFFFHLDMELDVHLRHNSGPFTADKL